MAEIMVTLGNIVGEFKRPVSFLGEIIVSGMAGLHGQWRFRSDDLVRVLADCSWRAVPIVVVVNFLVGAILAFVGAVQLAKFGAGIFVADLVGIAVAREMAAIITAVVISGRTGAAFAAELASMQANEEIDALEVLGLPAVDFLVLPRVMSLLLMMPLLYVFACLTGVLGGMVVSISMLDISTAAYMQRSADALTWTHLHGWMLFRSLRQAQRCGCRRRDDRRRCDQYCGNHCSRCSFCALRQRTGVIDGAAKGK
jgi:phospholipid/cholesterol/gamma-HCH transport system permease protein